MSLVKFQPVSASNPIHNLLTASDSLPRALVVNILETTTGFRIELAAPGFRKEDFQIKLEKELLTVSANPAPTPLEEGARYRRREFGPSAFERVFRLPESIDPEKLEARFTNGILQILLEKKPELQPVVKTISVE